MGKSSSRRAADAAARALCGSAAIAIVAACGRPPARRAAAGDGESPVTALGTFPFTDGAAPIFGLGTPATPEELREWDIDILPDGSGLPPGRGTAAEGEAIYATRCAGCHGTEGEGASALPLVGSARKAVGYRVGRAPTAESRPTWLQFYPYATTLFDYIRNAMPWGAPGSLTDEAAYSLVAWMLWRNGIVAKDTAMDRDSLPRIEMPARSHFAYPSGAAPPR